jgi:GNAT superfamily N-acetyltransferase
MNLLPRRYVIYCLEPGVPVEGGFDLPGLAIKPFEAADIACFFAGDAIRTRTFREFLGHGYQGVLVHDGPRWAGYGWITTPGTPAAPHLSPWLGREQPFWLFYAHTREDYRGRGIQKAMLRRRLQALAGPGGRRHQAYADTRTTNVPSRRALLSLGFQPAGTMLRLEVPLLRSCPLCWWDRHQPHPPLAGAALEACR